MYLHMGNDIDGPDTEAAIEGVDDMVIMSRLKAVWEKWLPEDARLVCNLAKLARR